jgi:tRNA(Arg) A34 adenosine deaminase TadA
MNKSPETFMRLAFDTARDGMADGLGGPFGAVVLKGTRVISKGANRVVRDHDPTAHAEMVAIRKACQSLGDHRLQGCVLLATCEPCPMCLAAVYWSRIDRVYFAATRQDAAAAGFDDALIYDELAGDATHRKIPLISVATDEGKALFDEWQAMPQKIPY